MRSTNPERLEKCKAARATEALVWPEISANLLKANAATDESKKAHYPALKEREALGALAGMVPQLQALLKAAGVHA